MLVRKLGILFAYDKHVRQAAEVAVQGQRFVHLHRKVDKRNVNFAILQRFQRLRRVAGKKLYLHSRILFTELDNFVRQNVFENCIRCADANRPRCRAVDLRKHHLRFLEQPQGFFDFVENDFAALCGKLHPAVGTVEQRNAKLGFQLFNRLRYRWL